MFDGIRLILATDDRPAGAKYLLNVSIHDVPAWCLITIDPAVILNIPGDVPSHGYWPNAQVQSMARVAWEERRAAGPLAGYTDKTLSRIAKWQADYRERERELAFAHLTAEGPERLAEAPQDVEQPRMVGETRHGHSKARASKWL